MFLPLAITAAVTACGLAAGAFFPLVCADSCRLPAVRINTAIKILFIAVISCCIGCDRLLLWNRLLHKVNHQHPVPSRMDGDRLYSWQLFPECRQSYLQKFPSRPPVCRL